MPVIRIQALRKEGVDIPKLLQETSAAVAGAFGLEVSQCWSTFSEIQPGEIFEGGAYRGIDDNHWHSPLVMISAYKGRTEAQITNALDSVAEVVVSAFDFGPGDAFVEYRELQPGRVHTGGKVIQES